MLNAIVPIVKKTQKFVAFTLAETLIVIGVIGIVSALTLPNLNSSTGEKEKIAKVQKIYQNLNDAFGRAEAVYGPIDSWFINDNATTAKKRFAERILDYVKIQKTCPTDNTISCTAGKVHKLLDGNDASQDTVKQYSVISADGSGLTFVLTSQKCDYDNIGEGDFICGLIIADIDGIKGANVFGKDTFTFWVKKEGIYPAGYSDSSLGQRLHSGEIDVCLAKDVDQNSCAGWVIDYGNMDYLKLKDGKCPNGTTLSGNNTSCK